MRRLTTTKYGKVIWWGGWPWQWRFRYVRKSRWGPFGELVLGFIAFTWYVEEDRPTGTVYSGEDSPATDPRPDPSSHPEYWTE